MYNPIEEKRRLVQERIAKSFDSGINLSEEMGLEKAHQDGEMHPNGKWVWVASANGGKGDWRSANGRAHKKHQETNGKKEGEGEKKTIDDHASGASTDALKRAADDKNAKPEVREAAKKELEKRSGNKSTDDKDEQNKKWFIKKLKSEGANSNDSHFMSKNQEHFKDVLKKNGFDSFEDFEDWGMDHTDDKDIKKYDKIFFQCVNKIPASNFNENESDKSDKSENSDDKTTQNSESGFTEEDSKRFEELRGVIDSPSWHSFFMSNMDEGYKILDEYKDLRQKSFNQQLKDSGSFTREDFENMSGVGSVWIAESVDDNGKLITPYIEITLDKKSDVKKFIKDAKEKLGVEVSEDAFEFSPRNRYSDSYYKICVNPQTNEFDNSSKVNKSIKDNHYNKPKNETSSAAVDEIRSGKITTKTVENFLDDDDIKSKAFAYFNYGDDGDCTEEETEAFNRLEKLGAKIGKYFDWKEEAESAAYKMKMQTKGYRMFDISTSDGYLYLMIKNDKLKGDGIKKSEDEYLSVSKIIESIKH